ncbi:hypothetical protein T492DRAFT_1079811 [Pavlovales sp. CCMP2436]|nr:hypothetical protein T492DRAFT_1079811 [Pavlovales sp. CCMP2436]
MCAACHDMITSGEMSMRLMQLPQRPTLGIGPADIVETLCLSLQHNSNPAPSAGLRRLFQFCTFECKSALTARQGARTIERFVQYAHSPAILGLVNAPGFSILKLTIISGTETRGDIAVVVVSVDSWATDGALTTNGHAAAAPDSKQFRWMLQKERRPPQEGCWLVTEVLATTDWYLFNGDSGSTTTD